MGRIDEHQVDRLIDRALRGEPIPRGVLMMAMLCCELEVERRSVADALGERLPDPEVVRCAA